MKIGILTFHCAHNYGAVLQCYATQEFLKSKGYEVEIINYRPEYLLEPYRIFSTKKILSKNPVRTIKNIIFLLLTFVIKAKRWKGFERFINNKLNISNIASKDTIPSNYDAYIVGSDQIWNPKITEGFDGVYFCDFPFNKKSKKYIAYAASMESAKLDNNETDFYSKQLANFNSISVREAQLKDLLQPLTSTSIKQVLDPTLMVSPDVWNSFTTNKTNNEKYVVIYQVRHNQDTIRIAQDIAKQIDAKIKILVAWPQLYKRDIYQTATPEDFANIIRNAECVVTTSFHGTAFSIIFNKPFYTIKLNDGADSRSVSLLEALNLEDRMIETNETPIFSTIDYRLANEKLDALRQESQGFLLNNL